MTTQNSFTLDRAEQEIAQIWRTIEGMESTLKELSEGTQDNNGLLRELKASLREQRELFRTFTEGEGLSRCIRHGIDLEHMKQGLEQKASKDDLTRLVALLKWIGGPVMAAVVWELVSKFSGLFQHLPK